MSPYGNGMQPVDGARRELLGAAQALDKVLDVAGKFARPMAIADFAEKAGVTQADARAALIVLEHAGLVETTHFKITDAGLRSRS